MVPVYVRAYIRIYVKIRWYTTCNAKENKGNKPKNVPKVYPWYQKDSLVEAGWC